VNCPSDDVAAPGLNDAIGWKAISMRLESVSPEALELSARVTESTSRPLDVGD
jgi:hypothetical protein